MSYNESELYCVPSALQGERISLYNLATWKNGLPFKKIDFSDRGKPIIKIAELNGGITSSTSFTEHEYSKDVFLTKGDLVFSWSGNPDTSIDVYRYSLPDGWLNQHIFKVTANNTVVSADYLYYILKFLKPNFSMIAKNKQTTGLVHVTISDLQRLTVIVPSLQYQEKVSGILKALDDKIGNNKAINHNLQQQIQSLYDSWFKRFEPFKSSMQDSELGSIPSNWQVKDIYSIASIIYGAPFSSKLFNTERNGKPIVRIRDLKSQETNTYTTECHPKGYLLKNGDIVVGMDGEFRPYIWGSDQAWLNQRVCVFVNKRPHGKAFLLYSIKPLLNIVEQTEAATTVIHIGKQDFDAFRIVLPPDKILNAFDEITAPMYDQIVNNICENRRLGILRDTLLPKLMSGEIDISEVEI